MEGGSHDQGSESRWAVVWWALAVLWLHGTEFRKYFLCLFLFLFLLVFDGYIIIIFYKNASGDGSASPNAEAVKLSEGL